MSLMDGAYIHQIPQSIGNKDRNTNSKKSNNGSNRDPRLGGERSRVRLAVARIHSRRDRSHLKWENFALENIAALR